ncbi:unnamed protein product, partial [Mesorhabditis spiculigera]
MAQGKTKQKTTLPKGVKQKVKKTKATGPKRGHKLYIAPKTARIQAQDKIQSDVSKVINDKNEELVKNKANQAQGRAGPSSKR